MNVGRTGRKDVQGGKIYFWLIFSPACRVQVMIVLTHLVHRNRNHYSFFTARRIHRKPTSVSCTAPSGSDSGQDRLANGKHDPSSPSPFSPLCPYHPPLSTSPLLSHQTSSTLITLHAILLFNPRAAKMNAWM